MDPNPTHHPILSCLMTRLPSLNPLRQPTSPSSDIEQPSLPSPTQNSDPTFHDTLLSRMPHLNDPSVISEMSTTVSQIAQTRSVLQALGTRPDHESVDSARSKLDEISIHEDAHSNTDTDLEKEKSMYKAIVQVDEMHEAYEKLLRSAEEKLARIYDSAAVNAGGDDVEEDEVEVNEDVVRVLKEESQVERVDLSAKKLRILPEAFGRLKRVLLLNLSTNQLQVFFIFRLITVVEV